MKTPHQKQNSVQCSPAESVPVTVSICLVYSSVCCLKKKTHNNIAALFLSLCPSSPPLGPQLVSVCKSWGLGCQMSGLVLSCQTEEWAEMIDDWEAWNPTLHRKCFFYKKAGATHSAYIQGHFAYHYTHCCRLPTSQAIHVGADFSPQLCSLPGPHNPPLVPSQARAQMLEYLIPVKQKKKINEKIWSFCFVLFRLVFLQATFALRSHGLELSGAQVRWQDY